MNLSDVEQGVDLKVFHSGLVTSGGHVLDVTALGRDVAAARDAAYTGVDAVVFPGGFCRRDIGWREIERG
ncbi:MAG: hypothetical protein JY451_07875 [Erythrobacter sp.]|nr:MAG: hypothetical protein JY451_07875 [Erythrobacter sp.]